MRITIFLPNKHQDLTGMPVKIGEIPVGEVFATKEVDDDLLVVIDFGEGEA